MSLKNLFGVSGIVTTEIYDLEDLIKYVVDAPQRYIYHDVDDNILYYVGSLKFYDGELVNIHYHQLDEEFNSEFIFFSIDDHGSSIVGFLPSDGDTYHKKVVEGKKPYICPVIRASPPSGLVQMFQE